MEPEIDETQADEAEVGPEAPETGESQELNTIVTFAGRSFELKEPTPGTILSILNVIAEIGIRAEKKVRRIYRADGDEMAGAGNDGKKEQPVKNPVQKMMENPSAAASVFGFMSVMNQRDLVNFGLAVLQLGDNDDDAKWLKANLKIAPLIDAFFIDLALSPDLMESLKSFFRGAGTLGGVMKMFGQIGKG